MAGEADLAKGADAGSNLGLLQQQGGEGQVAQQVQDVGQHQGVASVPCPQLGNAVPEIAQVPTVSLPVTQPAHATNPPTVRHSWLMLCTSSDRHVGAGCAVGQAAACAWSSYGVGPCLAFMIVSLDSAAACCPQLLSFSLLAEFADAAVAAVGISDTSQQDLQYLSG